MERLAGTLFLNSPGGLGASKDELPMGRYSGERLRGSPGEYYDTIEISGRQAPGRSSLMDMIGALRSQAQRLNPGERERQAPETTLLRNGASSLTANNGMAAAVISTLSPGEPALRTKEMISCYKGEHLPGSRVWGLSGQVKYLSPAEREAYRLEIRDGKLYDSEGTLFDTRHASSLHSDEPRAMFIMDEKGAIYASNYQELGKFHHSSFLAGGKVAAAGELVVEDGVMKLMSNRSGHYRTDGEYLDQALQVLKHSGIETGGIRKDVI